MREIIDITKRNATQVPARRGDHPIEWIVIHYLGVPNADNPDLYGGGYGGHYNITREGKIYKAADPRTAVVWHCGGGLQGSGGHQFHGICTNWNSIGIENGVCHIDTTKKEQSGDSGGWYFTTETQEALVELTSRLMDEYHIPAERVIRHFDVTGKICPNPYVKNNRQRTSWTWDEFKERLAEYRKERTEEHMATYTNSPLVVYTKYSPNHSGQRTHSIDRITPHCVVGQCTAEGLGDWFSHKSTQASSNYGIDKDGRVGLYVDEKNRSWCSSSNANDQRAVTIECASDTTEPYAFRAAVYSRLIDLCADICKRNGKTRLLWISDKDTALAYNPKSDEMLLTVHRWFANKSCPGNWLMARMDDLATQVTKRLGGTSKPTQPTTPTSGTQAKEFAALTEAQAVAKIGPLAAADQKKSGILASVTAAQFILESGYGKSELAQAANNCFGMKKSLSGNTWSGTTWDGSSVYTKKTKEDDGTGNLYTITADFRKYPNVEASIADHSAYLNGAKNGNALRYAGLKGEKDPAKAVHIIKAGGYATSTTYEAHLLDIIKRWNLTQYDAKDAQETTPSKPAPTPTTPTDKTRWFRVRKTWTDTKSQKGAFKIFTNAVACADNNPGYAVFDYQGRIVYAPSNAEAVPFLVKVTIDDLNIRKGPGTNNSKTGQFTGKGIFTIMEVKPGQGSEAGWGRLKSGAGWISLDYAPPHV